MLTGTEGEPWRGHDRERMYESSAVQVKVAEVVSL